MLRRKVFVLKTDGNLFFDLITYRNIKRNRMGYTAVSALVLNKEILELKQIKSIFCSFFKHADMVGIQILQFSV